MSQARQIYDFLTATNNKAADTALLLALRRAEEPYRTVLLEIILDRGKSAATSELIAQWHQFSREWQKLMVERAASLYGGLFQAARDSQMQTRLNCLDIIKRARFVSLSELVVLLLRDRVEKIAREAGLILLDWARYFRQDFSQSQTERAAAPKDFIGYNQTQTAGAVKSTDAYQLFISALERVVRDYPIHQRLDGLRAAMCLVGPQAEFFWKDRLSLYSPVGRAVRDIMLNSPTQDIAGFCLSALGNSPLRGTAVRILTNSQNYEFLIAIGQEFLEHASDAASQGLSLIKQPRWLDIHQLKPDKLASSAQLALVALVGNLGGPRQVQIEYLASAAKEGTQAAALEAVKSLGRWEDRQVMKHLIEVSKSPYEWVVLAVVKLLVRKKYSALPQLMVRLLSSKHERVRELAQNYLRERVFEAYWNNFDRLTVAQRIAAGNAVFKLDPAAAGKWRDRSQHISGKHRLRAVQIARLMRRDVRFSDAIRQLTGDPDRRVRSCAVAGLGELSGPTQTAYTILSRALLDADSRVRANAIEALERRGIRHAAANLEHFLHDVNSRVRANAVKALLSWRVESARQAIRQMLSDPRPRHRRSARWVVQQMAPLLKGGSDIGTNASRESTFMEKTDDRVVMAV